LEGALGTGAVVNITRLAGPKTHICWTPDYVPEGERELVSLVREDELRELERLGAKITVVMNYDEFGDPSTGIPPGWDDECYVDLEVAELYVLSFAFAPNENDDVEKWIVDDVQCNLRFGNYVRYQLPKVQPPVFAGSSLMRGLAWEDEPRTYAENRRDDIRNLLLGDLPLLCEAVSEHWEVMKQAWREHDEALAEAYRQNSEVER